MEGVWPLRGSLIMLGIMMVCVCVCVLDGLLEEKKKDTALEYSLFFFVELQAARGGNGSGALSFVCVCPVGLGEEECEHGGCVYALWMTSSVDD